jgi:hypothetical protein
VTAADGEIKCMFIVPRKGCAQTMRCRLKSNGAFRRQVVGVYRCFIVG